MKLASATAILPMKLVLIWQLHRRTREKHDAFEHIRFGGGFNTDDSSGIRHSLGGNSPGFQSANIISAKDGR